jgi:ferredoxin-type protein NapF
MNTAVSRRGLLTGRAFSPAADYAMRPPWARPEPSFIALCTRCDACIRQCETGIILKGSGGYPEIDFNRGECTFCERCVTACDAGALSNEGDAAPWSQVAQINEMCLAMRGVECHSCDENCPNDAIRFRPQLGRVSQPEINTEYCTACGACVKGCPAKAIILAVAKQADPVVAEFD